MFLFVFCFAGKPHALLVVRCQAAAIARMSALETEKDAAVAAEDFTKAASLKREITALASVVAGPTLGASGVISGTPLLGGLVGSSGVPQSNGPPTPAASAAAAAAAAEARIKAKAERAEKLASLEKEKAAAVAAENFTKATALKAEIAQLAKAKAPSLKKDKHFFLRRR